MLTLWLKLRSLSFLLLFLLLNL